MACILSFSHQILPVKYYFALQWAIKKELSRIKYIKKTIGLPSEFKLTLILIYDSEFQFGSELNVSYSKQY
jgi:hypothetical protein